VLRHVMYYSGSCLRSADVLFRHGSDEFVAMLNDSTLEAATLVAHRIRDAVRQNPLRLCENVPMIVDVFTANVTADGDSRSLVRLIDDVRLAQQGVAKSRPASAARIAARSDS
jgi:diguanylate cyclase (GGDEF)-like protein